jgi:IS5 family transposase
MLELSGLSEELKLEQATLTADCNYHSEANLQACEEHQVDAYIPDNHFRSRDPRFDTQERHKSPFRGEEPNARYAPKKGRFGMECFKYDSTTDTYTCPQGRELTCQSQSHSTGDGHHYRRYRSKARDCAACPLKGQCIARGGARKSLAVPTGEAPATLTAKMRQKIDTPEARRIYARRLAIVEPVFANLRSNKRLDRFTYRGLARVNVQWLLYCLVHNLEKIAHFSRKYGPKVAKHAPCRLLSRLIRLVGRRNLVSAAFSDCFRHPSLFPVTLAQTYSSQV